MLQQVLEHIHNYFIKSPNPGKYTVADGVISPLPPLKEGQRFWLCGSDLNDGVYTFRNDGIYNDDDVEVAGLQDESFAGTICALAIPPAVIALSGEIKEWVEKYGESLSSPYISESVVGVYSYEKMAASKVSGGNPTMGWQEQYRSELDRWRRPCL